VVSVTEGLKGHKAVAARESDANKLRNSDLYLREVYHVTWSDFGKHELHHEMPRLRLCLPLAISIALLSGSSVLATPMFNGCEIEGRGSEIMCCDLNGDGLDDLVLLDGLDLSNSGLVLDGRCIAPFSENPCGLKEHV
jgi:hypothetical protein